LRVIGDLDLIVSQVLLNFSTKNERLKKYRYFARSVAKSFEVVSIEAVTREENYVVDALAISTSTLQPCEGPLQNLCKMEVCLDHQSLITYNIGKFLKMIVKSLDSWKIIENSPIHK
jgi:hypothetical protein